MPQDDDTPALIPGLGTAPGYRSMDTKPPVPTYRYAQKLALERGDADTYYMRKTQKKAPKKPAPPAKKLQPMGKPRSMKKGGLVKKTGYIKLHKGERVTPAASALGKGKKAYPKGAKAKSKIKKTMDEWKSGTLHSGSKKGPKVTNQKQAVAIALSQARKGE